MDLSNLSKVELKEERERVCSDINIVMELYKRELYFLNKKLIQIDKIIKKQGENNG
ncbi:MAG: hypothetical protein ACRDA4_08195 [Filifactoraceae bacterium]